MATATLWVWLREKTLRVCERVRSGAVDRWTGAPDASDRRSERLTAEGRDDDGRNRHVKWEWGLALVGSGLQWEWTVPSTIRAFGQPLRRRMSWLLCEFSKSNSSTAHAEFTSQHARTHAHAHTHRHRHTHNTHTRTHARTRAHTCTDTNAHTCMPLAAEDQVRERRKMQR